MDTEPVMNKHLGSALASAGATTPVDTGALLRADQSVPDIGGPSTTSLDSQAAETMGEGAGGSQQRGKDASPEVPLWEGVDRQQKLRQLVSECFEQLVHQPASWGALNLRLKEKGSKDILFGVEDVIKERGPETVKRLLVRGKGPVDADLVWSLHQPLLSLLLFILYGTNDIHKKLVKVPQLKEDICAALQLGAPTKVKTPGPKPEATHAVKKLKRLSRLSSVGGTGAEASPATPVIKRLIVRKPGEKRALEEAAKERTGTPGAGGSEAALENPLSEGPLVKRRKSGAKKGEPAGASSFGQTPPSTSLLESVLKKSVRIKQRSVTAEGQPSKLGLKDKASTKKAGSKTLPGGDSVEGQQLPCGSGDQMQGEIGEDAELAALVRALRARGVRDVQAREEQEVREIEERLSALEEQQRDIASELDRLRAQRQGLVQQQLGQAGDHDVAAPMRAAREKCLQAIVGLLDVLPPVLDLNAVAVFNELEGTNAFDERLGALVAKQRAFLQREWELKNALAADAKWAGLAAFRKKDNVRQHLGILAASTVDESREFDAVFSAFQIKLIEMRREMEQRISLLARKENEAKQAWLVYKAAV